MSIIQLITETSALRMVKKIFIIVSLGLICSLGYMSVQKKIVPALTMLTTSGETISTTELLGNVYLINFWATDCPGCIEEMPGLVKTFNKYNAKNFTVIAVAMYYDPPSRVLSFTEKNKLPFPVVLDIDKQIINNFENIKLTPTTLVVNHRGEIVNTIIGILNFTEIYDAIDKLLQDSKVQP